MARRRLPVMIDMDRVERETEGLKEREKIYYIRALDRLVNDHVLPVDLTQFAERVELFEIYHWSGPAWRVQAALKKNPDVEFDAADGVFRWAAKDYR